MKKRILVIDDELAICRTIQKTLESTGDFEVSLCTDSRTAFQLAREQRPDVILIDVNMPGLSGPEIAEQLEEDEVTRDIPLVYMTGMGATSELLESENVIGAFIGKPFDASELIRVIYRALK